MFQMNIKLNNEDVTEVIYALRIAANTMDKHLCPEMALNVRRLMMEMQAQYSEQINGHYFAQENTK